MAVNKEMIKQIWEYIVKPHLEKAVKSTKSPIDDFIVKQLDAALLEFFKLKQ